MKLISSDSRGLAIHVTGAELDSLLYLLGEGCEHLYAISGDELVDSDTRRNARTMMLRGERMSASLAEIRDDARASLR